MQAGGGHINEEGLAWWWHPLRRNGIEEALSREGMGPHHKGDLSWPFVLCLLPHKVGGLACLHFKKAGSEISSSLLDAMFVFCQDTCL